MASNTLIFKAGNLCKTVYIIGEVDPARSRIELRREVDGLEEVLKDMSSYHWGGYVELIITYTKRKLINYKVSLLVAHTEVPVTYFEVDVEALMQVFHNKAHGNAIRKAIFARLLHYCSQDVLNRGIVFLEVQHDLCRAQTTYELSTNKTEEVQLMHMHSDEAEVEDAGDQEPIWILRPDEIDYREREHSSNIVSIDAEVVPDLPKTKRVKVKHRTKE
eukprot:CAMPEP_0204896834 /NCGR_PEP_ID=MMETSP1397-20131031/393_1 /ASSEMBLY_ACC=CAM_ASM_000891 /TAXON_ID=49980 /ORGANISM="Climacostomum Climacostomum virens, Strain Stock W-24" /LENGTH=217 /DNA_ID=CAMNT_0052064501 /DNA_START=332 /DNA_END=985 /DNA_ORIENTATION=+